MNVIPKCQVHIGLEGSFVSGAKVRERIVENTNTFSAPIKQFQMLSLCSGMFFFYLSDRLSRDMDD